MFKGSMYSHILVGIYAEDVTNVTIINSVFRNTRSFQGGGRTSGGKCNSARCYSLNVQSAVHIDSVSATDVSGSLFENCYGFGASGSANGGGMSSYYCC